jgi:hypothetical protein
MKSIFHAILVGAATCLSGCFTLDSADLHSTGEEHVCVGNRGWYLFHVIPLACGNASEDPLMPWAIFRNDVTMDKIQKRFVDYANFYGKKTSDMTYYTQESVLFEIPGTDFPIPIPYLLTYREIQLSGVIK